MGLKVVKEKNSEKKIIRSDFLWMKITCIQKPIKVTSMQIYAIFFHIIIINYVTC